MDLLNNANIEKRDAKYFTIIKIEDLGEPKIDYPDKGIWRNSYVIKGVLAHFGENGIRNNCDKYMFGEIEIDNDYDQNTGDLVNSIVWFHDYKSDEFEAVYNRLKDSNLRPEFKWVVME